MLIASEINALVILFCGAAGLRFWSEVALKIFRTAFAFNRGHPIAI
jgi:hypothetical protein